MSITIQFPPSRTQASIDYLYRYKEVQSRFIDEVGAAPIDRVLALISAFWFCVQSLPNQFLASGIFSVPYGPLLHSFLQIIIHIVLLDLMSESIT